MNKIKKILLAVGAVLLVGMLSMGLIVCGGSEIKVSFETNGAEKIAPITAKEGKEVALPTPQREDYRFDGWYLTSDFSGEAVETVIASANVTYYAKWTRVYAVNLDLNGGALDTTKIFLAQGDNVYDAVKNLQPAKDGLIFGAWFNGNNELSSSATMKAGELNLTAQYKVEYTVHLYKKNLDNEEYTQETVTGSDYVGKSFTSSQRVVGFVETTENEDALTKILSANPADNVFVHYFDRNTYNVTFDPKCPTGEDIGRVSLSAKYESFVDVPSDPRDYQVKGYCLVGWTSDINSTEVEYPVDLNAILYNKEIDKTDPIQYKVEKTVTLYGVWEEGYTDMFGGDDYIFHFENDSDFVYLCRANIYFRGDYLERNQTFYFDNEVETSGKLYNNGKFVFSVDERHATCKLYTTDNGIQATEQLIFYDTFNGVHYVVYEESEDPNFEVGRQIDISEGTYEVAENGDYIATFSTGKLADKSISFILSSVLDDRNNEQAVFQVRKDDEYQLGKIVLAGVRRDNVSGDGVYVVGYIASMYFELDGFGTAKFTTNGQTSTYSYTTDKDGNILLRDRTNRLVETIRLVDIPGVAEQGYMVYDSAMNNTFDLGAGDSIQLDGLHSAVYVKQGTRIESNYRYWTTSRGDTIISIIDPATYIEYRFLMTPTTVVVDGESVDSYTAEVVLNTYTQYYYMDESGIYYAPLLIIDEEVAGKASLYGYTADRTFQKVMSGSYSLIEEGEFKGLYMFVRDSEVFDAPDVFNEPIDLANISSFIFALDQETTGYSVSYWYVSNNGVEDTEYFENYTTTDLTSNASLKLVGGFAFYQENTDSRALIASYTQSGSLLEMTVDETTYYFMLDEANEKFTVLQYAPYKAYLRNADGTYSTTKYLEFDGMDGAVYADNGLLIDGKMSILEKGGLAQETKFGEALYQFTPNDPANAGKAFTYISVTISGKAYYAIANDSFNAKTYYSDSTSTMQGSLTIDGYCYWAEFNVDGTIYAGLYDVDENLIVLHAGDKTFYFDFQGEYFTVRDQEYGVYALFVNNFANGIFVEFNGYGKLSSFTFDANNQRVYIETDGTYTVEDGVYTFSDSTAVLGNVAYEAVDGKTYKTLNVSNAVKNEIFVSTKDWSVLILDEYGRALKSDESGIRQEGTYIFVTDSLLYFINNNGEGGCLYNYSYNNDNAIGSATPIELRDQSYYTETLKSLFFSGDGFVIINGDEENPSFYNYEVENGEKKVIIYSREKIADTDTEVENYDFWRHDFGTLNDSKEFNGEIYYKNSGKDIVFTRSGSQKSYPLSSVDKNGEDCLYYPTKLRFTPSGAEQFTEDVTVTFTVGESSEEITQKCTITREILNGEALMYVTINGYFRYYISANYTTSTSTFEVLSLKYNRTLDAYFHLNEYFYTYMYEGKDAADNARNKFGKITIQREYAEDGSEIMSQADVDFREATEMYDMEGNRISCTGGAFSVREDGVSVIEFVALDGYTYQLYFGVYRHQYMTMYGYYIHALVRVQEMQLNGYKLLAGRVVATEQLEEDQPLGEVYSLSIIDGEEEIKCDEFFYANGKLEYVVRERDQDGYVTKAAYYTIVLQENESSALESGVPDFKEEGSSITYIEATIKCEADPEAGANYQGRDRYVEMANGEIKVLYLVGNKRYMKECEYDEEKEIYVVKTVDGRTYYVKDVGENVIIADNIDELL